MKSTKMAFIHGAIFCLILSFQMGKSENVLRRHNSDNLKDDLTSFNFFGEDTLKRKIDMSVNTGCIFNNCTLPNGITVSIVNLTILDACATNVSAESEQHWLWSVVGRPALQTALTSSDNHAIVNWSKIFGLQDIGHSIYYAKKPIYTGALMLMNLIEFEDSNDTATLEDSPRDPIVYPLKNFNWLRIVLEETEERVAIQFVGHNYTTTDAQVVRHGTINLTISAYSNDGFGRWLPHLSHDYRTNQVDIQLDGINTTSMFKHSRFAIELCVTSDAEADAMLVRQTTTTLDDEHTPGIFKTEEIILPGPGLSGIQQTYLQWRPVVYTTTARDLSESTGVTVGKTSEVDNPAEYLNGTLLYALYGTDLDKMLVRMVNVTFGSPEDGFYKKTRFQAWTFTFGIGDPIRNGLSPVVIVAFVAMMAVILFTSIVASMTCIYKKWQQRDYNNSTNYSRINL